MKKWIKNLFSNSDEASSKRTIALLSFVVLFGMVVLNAFKIHIDPQLIYVFAVLCGGSSGLTVVDKFFK